VIDTPYINAHQRVFGSVPMKSPYFAVLTERTKPPFVMYC
jgi:hypothetical protein